MQSIHRTFLIAGAAFVIGTFVGTQAFTQKVPVPVTPTDSTHNSHMQNTMNDMVAGLEGKSGDAFDQAFLEEMIIHHQGAVDMAEIVLHHSERQELRDFAQNIVDAQTSEIDTMKQWQRAWFTE